MRTTNDANVLWVYLDSSVLVALAVAFDLHHNDAVRTCVALLQGGHQLITSRLAIIEAIGAVRKKITMSHRYRSGSEEERAGVDADAAKAVEDLLKLIRDMVDQDSLKIVEPRRWSPDFSLLYGSAIEQAGHAVHTGNGKNYRYRGVGSCDWLNFLLALDSGASVICTADAAFADIEGSDSEFGHIKIQMVGGPLIAGVL